MQNTTRGTAGSLEKLMAPQEDRNRSSGKILHPSVKYIPNPVIISPTLAFSHPDKITMWGRWVKFKWWVAGGRWSLEVTIGVRRVLKMEPGRQLQKIPKGYVDKAFSRAVLRKGKRTEGTLGSMNPKSGVSSLETNPVIQSISI